MLLGLNQALPCPGEGGGTFTVWELGEGCRGLILCFRCSRLLGQKKLAFRGSSCARRLQGVIGLMLFVSVTCHWALAPRRLYYFPKAAIIKYH